MSDIVMKVQKLYYIYFTLFLGLLCTGTLSFAGQKVTARGLSFFEPGRELIAREKALDEAKRAAIEQVIGAHISSVSLVENFQLVQDQIFSRSSGYLKNIRILNEKKTSLGTYEVTIEAEVEVSALVNDIERFQNILNLQNNPRVYIRINPSLQPDHKPAAIKVKTLLTDRLQQAGFILLASPSGIDAPCPGLILDLSTEISSTTSQYQDITITLNELSCSASIIRSSDNKILATATATVSLPGENRLQVMERGAQKCVSRIWKTLRQKLLSVWEQELYGPRELTMLIHCLHNYNEAKQICKIIKADITGVQNAKLLKFRHKTGIYVIQYKGWPEFFVNEMSMSYFQNKYFSFTIENMENNKIVIKINKFVCKK
jgi:hypothetical protein